MLDFRGVEHAFENVGGKDAAANPPPGADTSPGGRQACRDTWERH